jgi:hypothetical protein
MNSNSDPSRFHMAPGTARRLALKMIKLAGDA